MNTKLSTKITSDQDLVGRAVVNYRREDELPERLHGKGNKRKSAARVCGESSTWRSRAVPGIPPES